MNIDTLADTLYENFNNGYSDDTQVECARGIHFFLSLSEAKAYS
jgi:hypothetical protein